MCDFFFFSITQLNLFLKLLFCLMVENNLVTFRCAQPFQTKFHPFLLLSLRMASKLLGISKEKEASGYWLMFNSARSSDP